MKKLIKVLEIILVIVIIIFVIIFGVAFVNMIIDHKCYVMDDETFYSSEICKKYWEDRKNEK